jgi:hypothetical protein
LGDAAATYKGRLSPVPVAADCASGALSARIRIPRVSAANRFIKVREPRIVWRRPVRLNSIANIP